jgi:phage shock protein PspC (stress-responsive transcriptional regulator)
MEENTLQRLAKSNKDKVIGGVCGGLGEHTSVPAWTWRLLFVFAVICFGTGVLLYILMWIFMPSSSASSLEAKPANSWLSEFRRSEKDRKIAGICGGLGEHSDVPSWTWRVIFVALAFFYGFGIIAYILLWIFAPKVAETPQTV